MPSTATTLAVTGPAGVNVNWGAVPGATFYDVYGRTGTLAFMATVTAPTTTWLDAGTVTPSGVLPTAGTSATISTTEGATADHLTTTAASGQVAMSGANGSLFCPGANTACFTSDGIVIAAAYLNGSTQISAPLVAAGIYGLQTTATSLFACDANHVLVTLGVSVGASTIRSKMCTCTSDNAATPVYAWKNITGVFALEATSIGNTTTCPDP
jgi:hypothetical protein